MTYAQAIELLYSRLPLFMTQGGAAYKPGLERTERLLAHLGNPHHRLKAVHLAGTNGKGSTCAMLAALAQGAGVPRVGLYTSPHLLSFTERISINGTPVPEAWVAQWVTQHWHLTESLEPSFFEFTTAMAFCYLAEQAVDLAIIEVGLGGRLDATNVLTPALAVITHVDYDHMKQLGTTKALIASEKAGIMKPGVPVVIGRWDDETEVVYRASAAGVGAPLHYAPDLCSVSLCADNQSFAKLKFEYRYSYEAEPQPLCCDLTGTYQQENLTTALATAQLLAPLCPGWHWSGALQALGQVRQRAGLRARYEVLARRPYTVADVAHNPEGLAAVLGQFTRQAPGPRHIVFACMADKDVAATLALLPRQHTTYYWPQLQNPRALAADQLAAEAQAQGLAGQAYPDAPSAYTDAVAAAGPAGAVLITGSTFLVAEVLPLIGSQQAGG